MIQRILVTNDDGVDAKGISYLSKIARKIAKDVVVVAPNSVRSGMGMAIGSVHTYVSIDLIKEEANYREFSCSGTPVDCVKLSLLTIMKDNLPDLILSGINHGSNAASNVMYSGTMGAAIEGVICGIPSIGFSLLDYHPDADFAQAEDLIEEIIRKITSIDHPVSTTFNVNIPAVKREEIRGYKFCHQARAFWDESFHTRISPEGKTEYQLVGDFVYDNNQPDSDMQALNDNYIAIVPIHFDLTDYALLNQIQKR